MSRNSKFHNPEGVYFVSFAVVEWIDAPNHTKGFVRQLWDNPQESRKEWMLSEFAKAAAKSSNVRHLQFWRHNNPVEEGLVARPEDYVYSSAKDYSREKGILENVVIK